MVAAARDAAAPGAAGHVEADAVDFRHHRPGRKIADQDDLVVIGHCDLVVSRDLFLTGAGGRFGTVGALGAIAAIEAAAPAFVAHSHSHRRAIPASLFARLDWLRLDGVHFILV